MLFQCLFPANVNLLHRVSSIGEGKVIWRKKIVTCLSQSTRLTDRNVARESKNHATVIPSHMLFFFTSQSRAPDVQKEKPCVNRYRVSRPVATAEPTPTHGARLYCPYAYMETVGRSFSLHWHFGPRVTVCLCHIIYKLRGSRKAPLL